MRRRCSSSTDVFDFVNTIKFLHPSCRPFDALARSSIQEPFLAPDVNLLALIGAHDSSSARVGKKVKLLTTFYRARQQGRPPQANMSAAFVFI